jgi:hypothetical protein
MSDNIMGRYRKSWIEQLSLRVDRPGRRLSRPQS